MKLAVWTDADAANTSTSRASALGTLNLVSRAHARQRYTRCLTCRRDGWRSTPQILGGIPGATPALILAALSFMRVDPRDKATAPSFLEGGERYTANDGNDRRMAREDWRDRFLKHLLVSSRELQPCHIKFQAPAHAC